VAHIGMADVAAADRLAFDFVAAEECRSAPAGKRGGKLPAEIDGIAQAGVEAKPRGWMIEMGGVGSQENAAGAIGIRPYGARHPAADRDDLVRYALADHVVEHALDVDLLGRVVILFAAHAEPVELAAVEDDEIAPEPLGLDEVDQRSLAHDVMLPQLRRLHEDAEEVAEIGRAAHGHAELAADHAVPAAAVDRITGDNAASLVARKIVHGRDDMVVGLGELIEAPAIAQVDALKACREVAQDRVEPDLVAALRPLRARGGRPTTAVVRPVDAGDLEARERCAIECGVREVLRR